MPDSFVFPTTTLAALTVNAADADAAERAEQVFAGAGVVVVRGVVPSEICAPVAEHLRRGLTTVTEVFASHGLTLAAPDAGPRAAALLRDPAVSAADRHVLQGHFPRAARLDPISWRIPIHLETTPFVRGALRATALYAHMPPMFRFVLPGHTGAAVPAHRDTCYNAHLGSFCTVWVPFVAIDAGCAGMAVYPGSHQAEDVSEDAAARDSSGWLPPASVRGFERVELHPLAPGDIVIMDRRTLHESMANTSGRIRLSADYRFFGDDATSSKHYLDIAGRTVIAPPGAAASAP